MSRSLIGRSPDLKRLRDEGYNLVVDRGHLVVRDIPYVAPTTEIKRGDLVMVLDEAGGVTVPPASHVAFFTGEHPCHANGQEIIEIKNQSADRVLANRLIVNHMFSAKPVESESGGDTPFCYTDTSSSRSGIQAIAEKLANDRVAIIGLGGTGSYVLDFVAKTPVKEIHLFDGDDFFQHNAFRAPGAPSIEQLRERPRKATYFGAIYSKMHQGVLVHDAYLSGDNLAEMLDCVNFAFLCVDPGPAKKLIIDRLVQRGTPFVDTGIGLYERNGALAGMLRVTTGTAEKNDHLGGRISLSAEDGLNVYAQNIQIAELNAIAAALAVLKWKKLRGFYLDLDRERHSLFTITGNHLANTDRTA